ncbi:hypothetical protein [Jiangella anatolica]|uniref:Uncharacterized protein n=1 Tax=Jiangella anatolica TaxID=2670374 RepID=A0A2W2CCP7_9ACTN|nr:hypothetical protein [Jiangella anatolica]PZF86077.1 hypothetical protein C1I92_02535 [Jiangella anatolica]
MTSAEFRPVAAPATLGRLWWLPSHGYGNGLDDHAWAPVLDVDARVAMILLDAFRAAGVPAYTASLTPHTHASRDGWATYRIWVGSSAYGRAEDTLLAVMPGLIHRFGPEIVR